MMRFRLFAAALAFCAPMAAMAQTAAPVTVEVVGSATIDVPASWYIVTANYSVRGDDRNAADKAFEQKQDAIRAAVQRVGLAPDALTLGPATDMSGANQVIVSSQAIETTGDASKGDEDKPFSMLNGEASIRVATLDQAEALRIAFDAIHVPLGRPRAELADPGSAHRQAKAKALANAREDAAAYGRELGLRVLRVSRISEAGNNMLMPGLQGMMRNVFSSGPMGMQDFFRAKPGTVRVDETIIVEFVLGG